MAPACSQVEFSYRHHNFTTLYMMSIVLAESGLSQQIQSGEQIEQHMEHSHEHQHEGNRSRANYETPSESYPWKEGHYLGNGHYPVHYPAIEIRGDEGKLSGGLEMKITFVSGDFGEADPEVAKISGGSRYTVQEKIEIGNKERITPMVLTDDAFYFKSPIKTCLLYTSDAADE